MKIFFMFLSVMMTSLVLAQQLPQGTAIYQLDNGMDILLIRNPQLPMTGVNVVIKTGSAFEHFASSGMSHMLEHLLFNGTDSRTQKQLYDDVDQIGGYNNANTSYFFTNFMMVTPAEHIKRGMEIQADMLFHSTLPQDKFEKEKGIVLEEIARSLNSGDEQIERQTRSVLYKNHALSLPILGTYATIKAMQRDDVYRFYKNAYVPNNMVMSVIGNFDVDSAKTWIRKYYGSVAPGLVIHEKQEGWNTGVEASEPLSGGMYHRFYEGKTPVLEVVYHLPLHITPPQIDLLGAYFEEIRPNLETELKNKYPDLIRTLNIELMASPVIDYIKFSLNLNTEPIAADIIQSVEETAKKLSFIIPQERVKTQAIKTKTSFFQNIEKPHMFGIYNAELLAVQGIEPVLMSYESKYYERDAERLAKIGLDKNPVVIVHHPFTQKSTTDNPDSLVTRYENTKPEGPTIIARQNQAGQILAVHYLIGHKAALETLYGAHSAWILHDCLAQRINTPEIQSKSAEFGFTFTVNDNPYIPMDNIYLHPDFSYIRAEGLADQSTAAIRFLQNLLINFKPTEQEYEGAKSNRQRIDEGGMPGDRTRETFEKTCSNVLYEETLIPAATATITFDSLLDFTEKFFTPSNMIISVVSPVDADSVIDLIRQTYADAEKRSLPAYEKYTKRPRIRQEPVSHMAESDGQQSFIFWGFTVPYDSKDHAALTALSLVLQDRITFDIREKQGRAYRMSSGIELLEGQALFYVKLGTRPENVEPLLKQMSGFFKQDYLKNLTASEVTKIINMYLGRMMFRRLSSINQAYYLANSEYFFKDMNFDYRELQQLSEISLEQVQDVARRYMKEQNPVTIVVR